MHRTELEHSLNTLLNIEQFEDFCPNGLQVEGKSEVRSVLTAVSATLETIQEAARRGVDALIVHHGLFWNHHSHCVLGPKRAKLQLLLENEISLFAYHLPLDAHQGLGNNWQAARELGWEKCVPFRDIGVRGEFAQVSIEDFIARIEAYYDHPATCSKGGKETISSAALISGGAYKELAAAAKEGVDCFITGNFDEPAWYVAREEGIHFCALGHHATERIGPKALAAYLTEELGLQAEFLDVKNPF